ncbi:MAG: hypothetical protein AAGB46_06965 [Verrucomicrobiota bacterium]
MNTNLSSRILNLKLIMVFLSGLAAVVFMFDSKREDEGMTLLYRNLGEEKVARVVSKLEEEGLKVEARNGGVYVNSDLVYVLRAKLEAEGVSPGSIEILDNERVAM